MPDGRGGRMRLNDRCPLTIIEPWAWRIVELAETFSHNGCPPVAGGSLDQATGFLTAARIVAAENDRIEAAEWARHGKSR